jgi:hypothetical protein
MLRVWDAAIARPTRDIDVLAGVPQLIRPIVHETCRVCR